MAVNLFLVCVSVCLFPACVSAETECPPYCECTFTYVACTRITPSLLEWDKGGVLIWRNAQPIPHSLQDIFDSCVKSDTPTGMQPDTLQESRGLTVEMTVSVGFIGLGVSVSASIAIVFLWRLV